MKPSRPGTSVFPLPVVLFVTLFLAVVGGGAWFFATKRVAESRRVAEQALASIADLKSIQLEGWLRERRGDAVMVGSAARIRQLLAAPEDPKAQAEVSGYFKDLQQAYDYDTVALFDSRGTLMLATSTNRLRQFSCVDRHVQTALQAREVTMTDLHRGQPGEPVHLCLRCPLRFGLRSGATADGVVLLLLDPYRFLYPFLRRWPVPSKTGESLLVRREGDDVVYLSELRRRQDAPVNLRVPVDRTEIPAVQAVLGRTGVLTGLDPAGVPIAAVAHAVAGMPWLLLTQLDQAEIGAAIQREAWTNGIAIALATVAVLLALGLLWRQQRLRLLQNQLVQRQQVEAALRESEVRFRGLFENAQDALLLIAGPPWRLLSANPASLRLFGMPDLAALAARPPWELSPERQPNGRTSQELAPELIAQAMEQGSNRFEWTHRRVNGEEFLAEVLLVRVDQPTGPILQITVRDITARKEAELALQQSEANYRLLAENSEDFVTVLDAQEHRLYISPSYYRVTGWTPEEVIETPWDARLHPDDIPAIKAARAANRAGQATVIEHRVRCRDGTWMWVESRCKPIFGPGGAMQQLILWARDITVRKQAETDLRNREEVFSTIVSQAMDAIVLVDGATGRFVEFNTAAHEGLGYTREAFAELTVQDIQAEHSDDQIHQNMERIRAQGGVLFQSRHRHRDGHARDVRVSVRLLRLQSREYMAAVWSDITEQKKVEAALRASEQRFRTYVEQAADAIFVVDPEGRILDVNQRACDSLGYSRSELLEKRTSDIDQDFPQAESQALMAKLEPGRQITLEGRHRRKDGSLFPVEVRLGMFQIEGRPTFVGLARDTTERKLVEERARLLRDLGFAAAIVTRLPEALELCLKTALGVAGLDAGGVYLMDDKTGTMRLHCHAGLSPALARAIEAQPAESHNVRWMLQGKPFHGHMDQLELPANAEARQEGLKAVSLLPVLQAGRLVALLGVASHVTDVIPPAARDALETVAGLLASLIERLHAQEALRQVNLELEQRVTARTQELAHSEQRHRDLIETIPDWVWEVDDQGRYVFCGPQSRDLLGFDPDELLGRTPFELMPLDEAERMARLVKPIMARGEVLHAIEKVVYRKDERLITLETHGAPVFDAEGRIRGYRGVDHDITARKHADDQLRKLWSAVEQSPAAVIITDRNAVIEYVNPQFERATGYTAAEALGKNPHLLKSGTHPPDFYDALWRTLKSGQTWQGELCNRDRKGKLYWVLASITAIRNHLGEATHFAAVEVDITERRRMSEELRHAKDRAEAANRAKSVFLANMSHEIRTPMNAVLGFTQLLLRDPATSAEHHKRLTSIMRSGEHLLSIINEILEMARIEFGRGTLHLAPFELSGVLHDLETMFSLRAQAQEIAFTIETAANLPRFLAGDKTKLRQIFINLLGNAFKFTPHGGRVVLRLQSTPQADNCVRLKGEVEDTGPGIEPEHLARVFEPFFQTDSGKVAGGTGLGLSISRDFARLMGGDLTVRSQVGVGTRFGFEAPFRLAPPQGSTEQSLRPQVLRLRPESAGYRILIADDSPDNREVLTALLIPPGFSVRTATNGLDAIEQCQAWTPGLVILDLVMPVMDGFEAARRLRDTHGSTLKILILSASVDHETQAEAAAHGADSFLSKPFRTAELLERIRELTGVQFASAQPEPASVTPVAPPVSPRPSASTVDRLPADLLSALRKALAAAEYDELLTLLAKASKLDPVLARQLLELLERYDYQKLDALLNPNPN